MNDLDPGSLQTFPHELKLTPKLGKHIISMLDDDEQPKVNRIRMTVKESALIMKTDSNSKNYNRPSYSKSKPSYSKSKQNWSDSIKWEVLPGEKCSACLKNNHNIYKTGCPTFSQFTACKAFYDTCPTDKLKEVINAYKKYQRELSIKLKDRRNNDRCAIPALQAADYDLEDKENFKELFF
jgi:hypothetical protein